MRLVHCTWDTTTVEHYGLPASREPLSAAVGLVPIRKDAPLALGRAVKIQPSRKFCNTKGAARWKNVALTRIVYGKHGNTPLPATSRWCSYTLENLLHRCRCFLIYIFFGCTVYHKLRRALRWMCMWWAVYYKRRY
jgi:hypothetical protein